MRRRRSSVRRRGSDPRPPPAVAWPGAPATFPAASNGAAAAAEADADATAADADADADADAVSPAQAPRRIHFAAAAAAPAEEAVAGWAARARAALERAAPGWLAVGGIGGAVERDEGTTVRPYLRYAWILSLGVLDSFLVVVLLFWPEKDFMCKSDVAGQAVDRVIEEADIIAIVGAILLLHFGDIVRTRARAAAAGGSPARPSPGAGLAGQPGPAGRCPPPQCPPRVGRDFHP
jgi:hypothetical protein